MRYIKTAYATDNQAMEMHAVFQPIFSMDNLRIMGYEAFTRVLIGGRPVSVVSLLQWAKNEGLLARIERRICSMILQESRHLIVNGQLLFINLESVSFLDFLDGTGDEVFNGHAKHVVLELTEHGSVQGSTAIKDAVARWRELGVRLAVDDIASGHDRLRHILNLTPDYIKLNRELIADCHKEPRRRAMVCGLTEMSNALGAATIAEGIETDGEMQVLRKLGVPAGQGYYLCKPAPAECFTKKGDVAYGEPPLTEVRGFRVNSL